MRTKVAGWAGKGNMGRGWMDMHYHMASRSYQKLSVDLLLVMPSTTGLTPHQDLPKFAKEMEDSQKNRRYHWKNRRYLSKIEYPVISQKSNFSVGHAIWIHYKVLARLSIYQKCNFSSDGCIYCSCESLSLLFQDMLHTNHQVGMQRTITMPSKLHSSTAENLIPLAVVNQPLQEERFINPLSTLNWSLPNSQNLVSCAERGSTPTSILFEHRAMQLVPPGRHQGVQHVLSLNLHFGLAKCQNQWGKHQRGQQGLV